jgi:hypothetical protein
MLPETEHRPPNPFQARVSVPVTLYVRLDFVPPPLGVRLRPSSVLRAAMPETAIDENCDARAHECQIGAAARTWKEPIHPEPEAHCVDG